MSSQSVADLNVQEALQARGEIPDHLAIIMDGNGRWARQKGLHRVQGHREGVESVRDIVEACAQIGVRFLTLYTFSTENWLRPVSEVNALMKLLIRTLRQEMETFARNGIRLHTIGDVEKMPKAVQKELQESVASSLDNERMTLILALSYSGRWEIVEAARSIAVQVRDGELDPELIDESAVEKVLGTAGIPDPDLLIRTGGEVRISNFLLWQIAYAELIFTETYWPMFRRSNLYEAIRDYQDRDRRYGRVLESV